MLITIEKYNDESLCAIIEGDIDHHTSTKLRETIDAAVEMSNPSILKLDFSKVKFMDSSGIGLIMGRYRLMKLIKGKIELVNVPSRIDKLLKLSGVYNLKRS